MSLGDLVISLSANTASLASDMGKANQIMERFAYKAIQSAKQGEDAIKAMSAAGVTSVDRLKYAFQNLDIKSSLNIEQEKARIIASFNMIKNSGVATFSEIARANEAMQSKLDMLDGKINKNTGGMNLFGLASVAAIAKIQILYSLINTVMSAIGQAPGIAIDAVERFNSQVVGNAAMITSMQRGLTDVGVSYQKNKMYAQGVQEVLIKMDAETSASAKNLQDMNTQFMQQGILINTNNKKQIEGFKSVANALAAITANDPNRDMQFAQEIRALREMKDVGSNRLVQLLQTQGVSKEVFENWKRIANETKNYGYVLEQLAPYLQGFAAAQGDINSMWETIKSTTVTIRDEILRKGFNEALKEIGFWVNSINEGLKENSDTITGNIVQGLLIAKGLLESVSIMLNGPIGGVLKLAASLVLKIAEGWGIIATAVLPEAANQFNGIFKLVGNILMAGGSLGAVMLSGLGVVAQAIVKIGQAAWKSIKGDYEGAKGDLSGISETASVNALNASVTATKYALKNINDVGNFLGGGLGRILDSYDKFKAAGSFKSQSGVEGDYYPENVTVGSKDKKGKSESVGAFNSIIEKWNTLNVKAEPDEFLAKLSEIDKQFSDLQTNFEGYANKAELAQRGITAASIASLKAASEDKAIHESASKEFDKWYEDQIKLERAITKNKREMIKERLALTETEAKNSIANIQSLLTFGDISKAEAGAALLGQYQTIQAAQEEASAGMDRGTTAWLTQQHAIDRTREAILKLKKEQFDSTVSGAMISGLKEYAASAMDVASQIKNATSGAFKSMEDAIVNFAKTGKMNFKDMANSIISDMIRIAVRASITGPLASALGNGISGIFSIFSGPSAAGGYDIPSGTNPITQLHEKEMVLPAKYADSIRNMTEGGSSTPNIIVNIENKSGQQIQQGNTDVQFDGKQFIISTIIENVSNNGPLRGLMAGAGGY